MKTRKNHLKYGDLLGKELEEEKASLTLDLQPEMKFWIF